MNEPMNEPISEPMNTPAPEPLTAPEPEPTAADLAAVLSDGDDLTAEALRAALPDRDLTAGFDAAPDLPDASAAAPAPESAEHAVPAESAENEESAESAENEENEETPEAVNRTETAVPAVPGEPPELPGQTHRDPDTDAASEAPVVPPVLTGTTEHADTPEDTGVPDAAGQTEVPAAAEKPDPMTMLQHFRQDLQALRDRHPESLSGASGLSDVSGTAEAQALPAEVLQDYFAGGNLENAWLSWQQREQARTITALQQEVAALRQNLAAAERAPIRRGVTTGGSGEAETAAREAAAHRQDLKTYGFDLPYW